MSTIMENNRISDDFYLMKVREKSRAAAGQFYLLRAWDTFPVLSRPISVFDRSAESLSFLYRVVGQGTEIFRDLRPGREIRLDGPHGNGFPDVSGRIALVGGGAGIAPLHLAARQLKAAHPDSTVDVYLGFPREAVLVDRYEQAADTVCVNIGGFVTDDIDPTRYDAVFACGPEIMMRVLCRKCRSLGAAAPLYVSMERRMGCGIGACLVCTCPTRSGRKRVCADGPVMEASEVFYDEQET